MKLISLKILLLISVMLSLAIASGSLDAQVYKTVDEDGNVTYTDQPPEDGSAPIKLPELSVIEAPVYEKAPSAADKASAGEEEKPLRFLRKHYEDFAIVSPQHEESVWFSQQAITVVWGTKNPLEPGMRVIVSVDGARQTATANRVIPLAGLERGEHTVTAVLSDAKNRSIATATPVTFFVRQPGVYSNRGGG